MSITQWPEPINDRKRKAAIMPKLMRAKVVELMEAVGFGTASALSTGRLTKKINRLDRVAAEDLDLESEELNDLLDFVLESIKNGEKIAVEEDRPNIPAIEQMRTAERSKPMKGFPREFDGKKSKYDWNVILDGKIHVLEQGTDYDSKSITMGSLIRGAAKRKGVKVKVAIRGGEVTVQAIR